MKMHRILLALILQIVLFCCQPAFAYADGVSGTNWYLEGNVLYITGNLGDFRVASSSAPTITTSCFENAEILDQVQQVVVSEGVTTIGALTFFNMKQMESIILPSTLQEIHSEAFYGCRNLSSITIPENVTVIGPYAFMNCMNLKTVAFEGDAPAVGNYSYWYDCYSSAAPFTTSSLDAYYNSEKNWSADKMNALGGAYFTWHDVSILNSGKCGDNASWSYNIHHVLTISGSGEMTGSDAGNFNPWSAYNDEITEVIVKDGITSIPSYAFEYIEHLQSVRLPQTLITLACNAFNDCGELVSITIPASLQAFAQDCYFHRCESLKAIYYIGTESEWQQIQNHQSCIVYGSNLEYHFLVLHEALTSTCAEAGYESYYAFDDSENTDVYSPDKTQLSGIPFLPQPDHDLTDHPVQPATCIAEGTEEYWQCASCGKLFADPETESEIEEPVAIPAKGHTLTEHARTEPTCTVSGTEAYWECAECKKLFTDESCTLEIENPVAIRAVGHTLMAHPRVNATYTTTGTYEYWECAVCGDLFSDANARYRLYRPSVIPMKIKTQGNGWHLDDNVLYITSNLGDFRVASSSAPTTTTSCFEEAEILDQVHHVVVSEGVTIIGGLTFFEMSWMESISLPSTLQEIHGEAFYGCRRLKSITIPENVTIIGPYAFQECSSLKTVYFEGDAPTVTGISYWFSTYSTSPPFCAGYPDAYYRSDKDWTVAKMNAVGGSVLTWHNLRINSGTCGESAYWLYDTNHVLTISGSGVVASFGSDGAPWSAYSDEITSVIVKNGITRIPDTTFNNLTLLHTVQLPETLNSMACGAFNGCPALSSVTIPASVASFDAGSNFANCPSLRDVYYIGTASEWEQILNTQDCRASDGAEINVHLLVLHEGVPSTCTESGHESYYTFEDSDEGVVYSLQKTIIPGIPYSPLQEHMLTEHASVGATCTSDGIEAYWECTVCGKLFSDEDATAEIEAPVMIPAMGHFWSTSYVWADDDSSVTANRVCQHGDHPETEAVCTERVLLASPTETAAGSFRIVSKPFENPAFEIQIKDNLSIPALENMLVMNLPASLTTIETEAFSGIAAEAILLPDSCPTIAPRAFVNCEHLLYIRVPAGVLIPNDAFLGCPNVVIDQN